LNLEQNVLVWLDKNKISRPTIERIIQKKPGLQHIFENYYAFMFNSMEFSLAEAIHKKIRRKKQPNLQRNLHALRNLFENIKSINGYPYDYHSTEDKGKDMENVGVGFSCLFMNKFLTVPWERIAPIVAIGKRPDHIGISDDRTYIFEAKGTMEPHKIASKFGEAEEQKKANGLPPSDEKLSFVTYVPDKNPSFPSTIFVSDPPSPQIPPLDRRIVILMHYENVLYYANLDKTRSLYSKVLKVEIDKRVSSSTTECDNGYPCNFENLKQKLRAAFNAEKQKLDRLQNSGLEFIGKSFTIQTDKEKFKVFCGIDEKIITNIINLKTDIQFINSNDIAQDEKTAIFSDGSILHIDFESEPEKIPITNRQQNLEQMTNLLKEKSVLEKYQTATNQYHKTEQKIPMLVTIRR
jgi:hypothetical protein